MMGSSSEDLAEFWELGNMEESILTTKKFKCFQCILQRGYEMLNE